MSLKRTMCALLAASMMTSGFVATITSASAATVDNESGAAVENESGAQAPETSSANPYNLASKPADGNILHCLNWKLSDIKAEIPNIAKAGFTSVQTSPLQAHDGSGHWYWLYQPINFWPGNELGSEDELKSLCSTAEEYGVKVIVDIVANHFAGNHSNIPDELKGNEYYHNSGYGTSLGQTPVDWGNRWQVTHCDIGMPDLNSEHSLVQQYVRNYVQRLEQDGVDGIRWDAAKHIGLPSEDCNFWPNVLSSTMYNYGEILDSPGGDGATVMKEYTDYMSVTDNQYSNNTRESFKSGNVMGGFGDWTAKGVPATGIVYWAESHDTFFNKMESQSSNEYVINKAYAAIACRYGSQGLYMSRPNGPTHHEEAGYGTKGKTDAAFSPEVTAVNNFRNAMGSKKDWYTSSNGCAVITRQGGGAVIVKGSGSGSVSVENGGGYAKTGSYKDAITGNTFTVTESTISGTIGDSGIAVIYDGQVNPDPTGSVSATPASGQTFTDTLTVTLKADSVTNPTYTTSEGASGSYTNGQTIVVGASTAQGSTVTVTLTGKKSDGSNATASYTYTKAAPHTYPTLSGAGFVFDNSTKNWSTVNAYVYVESNDSVTTNHEWPGLPMTNCGNGYWKYDLDSKFTGSNIRVIFNNGSEQIPSTSGAPGFQMSSTDKKVYENDAWSDLPSTSNLSVSLSPSASSVQTGTAVTLTATATGASGTVNYSFKVGSTAITASGNKATWTPSQAGTFTITVTATDSSSSATATTTVNCTVSAATLTNNSTCSSSITLGDTINVAGKASGGTSPYKYTYYFKQSSQTDWTKKDVSNTTTSITIKPGTATTYNVKVVVTDNAGKTATKTFNCTVKAALANNSTCSSSITLGNTINVAGKASGGTSPYKYTYYFKQSSQTTWTKKDVSNTTTSVTIKPGTATTYNVKVVVTDNAGKTATKTFNCTVKTPSALVNNSSVASTSIVIGNTINVTGAATGGTGGYKYTYFFKKSDQSAWTQKDVSNTATSTTIKPGSLGTYNVMVTVTDSSGKTASKTFSVTVKTGTLTNTSKVAATTITLGDTINITASATGGSGGYKYTYYFKKSSQTDWTKKDVANTVTSTTIKPGAATTYNVKVVVTDSSNKTATKTFTVTVQTAPLSNKSSVSATSITLGNTVTLKGAAAGGSGSYTYTYYFKQSSASSWTLKGDQYTTATTQTLKPSTKTTYNIKIVVRDSGTGETVEKTMNVTVK